MSIDSPAVVALLRCPDLHDELEPHDLEVRSFEETAALLRSARRVQPRACVVGDWDEADPGRTVRLLRRELPFTDVVVWQPQAGPDAVRAALLGGARDVILDDGAAVAAGIVRRVLEEQTLLPLVLEHEDRSGGTWRFEGLISRNREMWDLFETCIRTAATPAAVLILGETGTGKDLIARAIHSRSGRTGRYVAVNCGAVPESLIDSQLFGHVEGAFTGAVGASEGLFRHSDGGTLFLDEIGSIPLSAQNRLLRALQSGTVRPVGGHEEIPVDVRVIAATSVPLDSAVENGTFREDLLYRLDVIRLIVPPLRDRPEDIVFLFGHFAQRIAEEYSVERPRLSTEFLDAVQAYEWPGNVRELENFVERLLLTQTGEPLTERTFRGLMRTYHGRQDDAERGDAEAGSVVSTRVVAADTERPLVDVVADAVEDVERAYLESLLAGSGGRMVDAAKRAGISRRTLLRKLQRYGIDKRRFRP
jgi:DNA-binding NtrC family response regulator